MKLLRRKLALLLIALGLLGGAAGWYAFSDSAPESALLELSPSSFSELKNHFNEAAGTTRIIVLLSPT
jgi:hypothetical protein